MYYESYLLQYFSFYFICLDFVTPLKKRRFARESLSSEQPLMSTPSTPSPSQIPNLDTPSASAYSLNFEESEIRANQQLLKITSEEMHLEVCLCLLFIIIKELLFTLILPLITFTSL